MGQTKKAIYKVDNGVDFDTIHFETQADMVKGDSDLTFDNSKGIYGKDTTGVAKRLANINSNNQAAFGNIELPMYLFSPSNPIWWDGTKGLKVMTYGDIGHKSGTISRDLSVSGTQKITGLGFKPRAIVFLATVTAAAGKTSIGVTSASGGSYGIYSSGVNAGAFMPHTASVLISDSSGNYSSAGITFDDDGFTLNWAKTGLGATGTSTIQYLALA